jgi:hypothetical protein
VDPHLRLRRSAVLLRPADRPSYPGPGAQRGRLATQLYQAITDLGLDVETIVGGHRGTDGRTLAPAAPLSYLKTAAGL